MNTSEQDGNRKGDDKGDAQEVPREAIKRSGGKVLSWIFPKALDLWENDFYFCVFQISCFITLSV